jgi:hypothetical protein
MNNQQENREMLELLAYCETTDVHKAAILLWRELREKYQEMGDLYGYYNERNQHD